MVSIILTSYNQEKYLEESIQSVLNQTYQDFELLIVDDCSTDTSWNIIQEYVKKYPIIKGFQSKKNMGGFFCWDIIKKYAMGVYVAMHHSDDVWEVTKLEEQVQFLEKHKTYAACFSQVKFIDENSQIYNLPEGHVYKDVFSKKNRSKEEWLNYFFYNGNSLCHPSILIRREMYEKYGLLETYGLAQVPDFLMWVKLCFHEEIYIYPKVLTKFRLRRNEQDNTSSDKPEVHIRVRIELYYLLQQYSKIRTRKEFIKIFPEWEEKNKDYSFNISFALAQLALKVSEEPYWLFAINILFKLINDPVASKEIEELYGYTYKNFMLDTAAYDIFGFKNKLQFLHSTLYIDDGDGFSEENKISEMVYINQDRTFNVEFKINNIKNIKNLRFDPTKEEVLKIAINRILVNGNLVDYAPINMHANESGYDVFYTLEPQYDIKYVGQGSTIVKIQGVIDGKTNIFQELVEEQIKLVEAKSRLIMENNKIVADYNRLTSSFRYYLTMRLKAIKNLWNK